MDNISEVLVPTDFSSASWQAVLVGIRLAKPSSAKLSLLHYTTIEDEDYNNMIKEKLNKLSLNLSDIYNIVIDGVLEKGNLNTSIGAYIDDNEIDVLVLGLDGEKYQNGDFRKLIQSLQVPVMVVPPLMIGGSQAPPQIL